MTASDQVTGLVLAGGRGSRMGGSDKGFVEDRGQLLIERAIGAFAELKRIIISANRNLERYETYGHQVVSDERADFAGPLSGIESAMRCCETPWLYVIPVDLAGIPNDWLYHLLAHAERHETPWVGTRDADRDHPFPSLWSCTLLPGISAYLDSGERRVMRFIKSYREHLCDVGDTLRNINTATDLRLD